MAVKTFLAIVKFVLSVAQEQMLKMDRVIINNECVGCSLPMNTKELLAKQMQKVCANNCVHDIHRIVCNKRVTSTGSGLQAAFHCSSRCSYHF